MAADDDRPDEVEPQSGYRSLPPEVRLDRTIGTVDPDAERNVDQHRALRDD